MQIAALERTYYIGIGLSGFYVMGGALQTGIAIDSNLDVGFYWSGELGIGVGMIGGDLILRVQQGALSDLWGKSINSSVDIGPIGGTASWDATYGNFVGGSISIGPGVPGISGTLGFSASSAKPDWGKVLGRDF
jgi:hypothetical protein